LAENQQLWLGHLTTPTALNYLKEHIFIHGGCVYTGNLVTQTRLFFSAIAWTRTNFSIQTTARHQKTHNTMAEPMVEPSAHAWAELPIQSPQQCLEIPGREDHFVVSGKFVMLLEPVVHSIMFGDDE
jgi:hypothetical protein